MIMRNLPHRRASARPGTATLTVNFHSRTVTHLLHNPNIRLRGCS
jgi:hypothetical protein